MKKTYNGGYHFLHDIDLSNKSRGLLATMLMISDSENVKIEYLRTICKDGQDAISSQLNELERKGYLKRLTIRDSHGLIIDTEYHISDSPIFTKQKGSVR